MKNTSKIALGGGCHWCTEAVFQSLLGVTKVEQGYVASDKENNEFSEGVVVYFNPEIIDLKALIEIHLYTHESTSAHSMRNKYRSAVYFFSDEQRIAVTVCLSNFQFQFKNRLITQVLPFSEFKPSRNEILNYYYSNPEKPFCKNYIDPKLNLLLKRFSSKMDGSKVKNRDSNLL